MSKGKTKKHQASNYQQKLCQNQLDTHPYIAQANFTSDHAWQRATFKLFDSANNEQLRTTGATWNMMNQCHDKAQCTNQRNPYANNPYNVCETNEEYQARKSFQLRQDLREMLTNNDFIFLQEVDWLENKVLRKQYEQFFMDQGWGLITTPPPSRARNQKQLVILYKKTAFTPTQSSPAGILFANGKYTGLEQEFTHIASGKVGYLTCLHLDYAYAGYEEDIYRYQQTKIEQDKWAILGGDCNHPQNLGIVGLIGNWNYATNFDEDKNGALSIFHGENYKTKKRYDGFFASPPQNTTIQIIEEEGRYFDKNCKIQVLNPAELYPKYCNHLSATGEPWIRTKHRNAAAKKRALIGVGIRLLIVLMGLIVGTAGLLLEMKDIFSLTSILFPKAEITPAIANLCTFLFGFFIGSGGSLLITGLGYLIFKCKSASSKDERTQAYTPDFYTPPSPIPSCSPPGQGQVPGSPLTNTQNTWGKETERGYQSEKSGYSVVLNTGSPPTKSNGTATSEDETGTIDMFRRPQ